MKKIDFTGLAPKEWVDSLGNLMGSFGNENIRANHIEYLEKKLIENGEDKKKDLSLAPNYYAWLSLMTEHIFWMLRCFCFIQSDLKQENLDLMYSNIVTRFCDLTEKLGIFSKSELTQPYKILIKILEIRHAITHKGFPNLIPFVLKESNKKFKKPAMTAGGPKHKFDESSTKEIIAWYSDPRNFKSIKAEFDLIKEAIAKGPGLSVAF